MNVSKLFRAKLLWVLLLLLSGFIVGACGGSDSPDATATTAPTATPASSSGAPASTPAAAPRATQAPQATTSSSGGTLDLDDAFDQGIELMEEFLDVLFGVSHESSARAAVDDVARIVNQLNGLEERLGDYSDAEIASAALSGRFRNFGQDLGSEMARLSANPVAFALLAEAFENLNPN